MRQPEDCISRTPAAPTATTGAASALGMAGMTVNGSVHPHGRYTMYWFEYGPTPQYGARTAPVPLGPRLAAHYREDWQTGLGGWCGGLSGKDLSHHPGSGTSGGFVRFSEPSADDHNHDDGIGTLHLAQYTYPGPLGALSLQLGGGSPDLRDARIALRLRGHDWIPSGSELLWWTQSQSNIELLHSPGWRRANWAYTGTLLTDLLLSGEWETAEYRLWNDTDQWTYAGNNRSQPNCERYDYWPLDESQRQLNGDFFHLLAFVDPRNPPRGTIDFAEFQLDYRNHSLLLPSNGGRLVSAPAGDDPATLTDGWRHGPGRVWRSTANPSGPLEFLYTFHDPVTIHAVQLHQNPDWPARDVDVAVSVDGTSYQPLVRRTLPEHGDPNANFAFTLDRGLSAQARFLRLRIESGYNAAFWGLGEIEVFGTGATMLPDDDIYRVHADIHALRAGTTCHYRIVAVNDAGTAYGYDRTFAVPVDARPQVITIRPRRVTATGATLEGRLNPMGLATDFWFEYGQATDYGNRTPPAYGGLQITPRTVLTSLTDLRPATTYHCRLGARNAHGTVFGGDAVLRTPP